MANCPVAVVPGFDGVRVFKAGNNGHDLRAHRVTQVHGAAVVAYQQMFYYREWPSAAVWLVAVSHAVGAFVAGALLFLAFEPQFTEQL